MFYPTGLGGGHFLLYILVPAILGIWAQIRVSSAFRKWGQVRASSNITGAECAREILQAAQIHDVDVIETNRPENYRTPQSSYTIAASDILDVKMDMPFKPETSDQVIHAVQATQNRALSAA